MGTRANWTFLDKETGIKTTIYTHWDGYPEGAAEKLQCMRAETRRGFAERFLAGNPESELTNSEGLGGDIEYHYTITRDVGGNVKITVHVPNERRAFNHPVDLEDFINKYARD